LNDQDRYLTVKDLREALAFIPNDSEALVCVSGSGPALKIIAELNANEPFVLLMGEPQ